MAYFEVFWNNSEGKQPECSFEIFSVEWNYDIILKIEEFKGLDNSSSLRFCRWPNIFNTINALRLLENILDLDWDEVNIELKQFIKKVSIENIEGTFTVEYLKEKEQIIFTINQTKDDWWNRPCNKIASIIFALEWSKKINELVLVVGKNVFNCIAHLQHEMLKDSKKSKK